MNLAIVHPGDMGVTVGAAMNASGHEVYWLPESRSAATAGRAQSAGFVSCGSVRELAQTVQGVVSVCPPHGAVELAQRIIAAGFTGTYVDANAVAPDTAREIESIVGSGFVDGGIIGPPAQTKGNTRLYLSGNAADEVRHWFDGSLLDAIAIAGGAGTASALKMCYAAYTKGSGALLLAIRAVAQAEGVAAALLGEWEISQPGLGQRSELVALGSVAKAWRFVGEMGEIASTFRSAGLPGEFHDGAAEIYHRIAALRTRDATFNEVLALLGDETSGQSR
ncbi:MAG: DUF1932 domain-containing protein [Gammaproteobacteria bacterium]|nr:DUF1932 domain-containing protein [Gammaproteobacteria bacterium]